MGYRGFLHLGAGLSVGLTGLAAGYAIGVVGDAVSTSQRTNGMTKLIQPPGCSIVYVTVTHIRGHGFDLDFRRGSWVIWVGFLFPPNSPHVLTTSRLIVALILNTRNE